jgi:hypothetical protein
MAHKHKDEDLSDLGKMRAKQSKRNKELAKQVDKRLAMVDELDKRVRYLEDTFRKQRGINYPRIPYFSGKH